jgi:hypothetical protein
MARSRPARVLARAGFVARAGFYLLLAGLVARAAYDGSTAGGQTNAHGALSLIAQTAWGKVAIAAAAVGFVALGVERLAGAVMDHQAERWRRVVTGLQGAFYLVLTWVPLSYVLGNTKAGSEKAQHQTTGSVLGWPGGRELVIAAGAIVLGVCVYQVRSAVKQDFTEGLALRQAPGWVRWFAEASGTIGIATRGLVFAPIGVFLIVAAIQADPRHARGMDAELALLARQSWWGPALLAVVALGLLILAGYSAVEARYRHVDRTR